MSGGRAGLGWLQDSRNFSVPEWGSGTNDAHSCSVQERQNTSGTGCAEAVPEALPFPSWDTALDLLLAQAGVASAGFGGNKLKWAEATPVLPRKGAQEVTGDRGTPGTDLKDKFRKKKWLGGRWKGFSSGHRGDREKKAEAGEEAEAEVAAEAETLNDERKGFVPLRFGQWMCGEDKHRLIIWGRRFEEETRGRCLRQRRNHHKPGHGPGTNERVRKGGVALAVETGISKKMEN